MPRSLDPVSSFVRVVGAGRIALLRRAGLVVIVALGTLLRLLGISFGLPYHHHWDEVWIVDSVVGMLRRHDDVPASYQYGEPLMWLTEIVFTVGRWLRHAGGDVTWLDAQTTVYLAARIATALVSATGTVAVYLAVRRSRPGAPVGGALAASLLYAVASELVLHSRYAVTDACLVALTAWTLACAAIYLARASVAWGALTALAAGLTFAFKAPGIMTTVIPVLATLSLCVRAPHLGQDRRAYVMLLAATVPIVLLTYVVLNPHVVDRHADAMRDLVGRYRQTRDGGFSAVYIRTPGLPHLLSAVVAIVTRFPSRFAAISLAVSAVSIGGIVDGVRKRHALTTVAAAYAVGLVLSVALPNRTFLFRNYLVVIPVMCIGFGSGVESLASALGARLRERGALGPVVLSALGLAAAVATVGLPVRDAIEAQRQHDDPRVRALDWIARQTRAGDAPAEVAATTSVFGKLAFGGFPEIRGLVLRPEVQLAAQDLEACPSASDGPEYVLAASYRDTHRAPSSDPWQPLWLFRECPGYEQAAAFDVSPHEVNLQAYPTWPGRVSAIVLRRSR